MHDRLSVDYRFRTGNRVALDVMLAMEFRNSITMKQVSITTPTTLFRVAQTLAAVTSDAAQLAGRPVVLPALVLQQHYFFTVNRVALPYPVRIINPQLPRRKRLKYYPLRIAESGLG